MTALRPIAFRKDGPTQSSVHSDGASGVGAIMPFKLDKPRCQSCGRRHVKGVPCFGFVKAFDPDQLRDEMGRWTSDGSTATAKPAHFFHGTTSDLKPGDIIQPSSVVGIKGSQSNIPGTESKADWRHQVAWATPTEEDGWWYAGLAESHQDHGSTYQPEVGTTPRGRVYEVQPIGPVRERKRLSGDEPREFSMGSARVIRQIDTPKPGSGQPYGAEYGPVVQGQLPLPESWQNWHRTVKIAGVEGDNLSDQWAWSERTFPEKWEGVHAPEPTPAPLSEQFQLLKAWDESKHPRGQPKNKGEFGPGSSLSDAVYQWQRGFPGDPESSDVQGRAKDMQDELHRIAAGASSSRSMSPGAQDARAFLDAVKTNASPSSVEVHRGMGLEPQDATKYAVGSEVTLPASSWSESSNEATEFGQWQTDPNENMGGTKDTRLMLLHLPVGTKTWKLPSKGIHDEETEHVTGGKFHVDRVEKGTASYYGESVPAMHVYLHQTDFNPAPMSPDDKPFTPLSREDMPQLGGKPVPGTRSATLPTNVRGNVDLSAAFLDDLKSKGVTVTDKSVDPRSLKPSQREINPTTVDRLLSAPPPDPKTDPIKPLWVSQDGYVIDGHHRWAADIKKGNSSIDVREIGMPIADALDAARKFSAEWGLKPESIADSSDKGGKTPRPKQSPNDTAMSQAQSHGGFSINPRTGGAPAGGFMVATPGHNVEVSGITDLTDPAQRAKAKKALVQYAKDNAAALKADPSLYIGGWHDTANAEFTLDLSENVTDRDEAATLGAQRNQQAIWDVVNGQEIETGGTGDRQSQSESSAGPVDAASLLPSAGGLLGGRAGGVGGAAAQSNSSSSPGIHQPLSTEKPPSITEPLPGLIAPHLEDSRFLAPLKGHTHQREIKATENWSATHFDQLPPEYQKKILHNVKSASPNKLTPEMMHANLSAVYDHAMSHHWEVPESGKDADGHWADGPDATAQAGHDWYRAANAGAATTAKLGGIPLPRAVGVVAAMSPQTDWDSNIAMADFLASKMKTDAPVQLPADEVDYRHRQSMKSKGDAHAVTIPNGKRLSEMTSGEAAWALYAMASEEGLTNGLTTLTGKPKKAQLSMGAQNVAKAVEIFRGADPDEVLSGHKVRSFFNNISDPDNVQGKDDVTVDTHMVAAATGYKVTASGRTIKKMFEAGASTAANVKGAYALFADAVRKVAKEKGVTPNQAQAIIWTHWQTVKGGHHGYREDFPEIKGDVPPKTEAVREKERESKARAARRNKRPVAKMLMMVDGRV